jgi:uncharacterized membrane protein
VAPSIGRRIRHLAPLGVAALFATSGTLHLVRPEIFEPLIPRVLPAPDALVFLSGLAELGCAAGLFARARWAGPASAALLLAIWPGNLQMALDATTDPTSTALWVTLLWLRMPLQLPLIWAVLQRPKGDAPAGRD